MMPVGMFVAALVSIAVNAAPAHKSLDFVGFSRNEHVNAWRETIAQPQRNGCVDHYSVIRVFDTNGEKLLAVYRDSGVRRTDVHNNFVFTSEATRLHDNPSYAQAHSHAEWKHVAREAHFHAGRMGFNDSNVRLNPDNDAKLEDVRAEDKTIVVDAQPGSAMGYSPVARLMDGRLITLGHFRVEAHAPKTQAHASVSVFYSRSGRTIAVLNSFHLDGANADQDQMLVVSTNDPIATTGVGTLQQIENDNTATRRMFIEMHPRDGADLWDSDLGRTY